MSDKSQTAAPPLQLTGVVKRFKQGAAVVEALRSASLTVESGEFVAVMGASGSGKSTLLNVMAGLTQPDEGEVLVEGQNIARLSDKELTLFRRRKIGLVFQSFNLIPSLNAEENVLLPLLAAGTQTNDDAKRAQALLDRLGLSERRQARPDTLSGGEQQRVAIARALIAEPAIILADEPTGSLDSVTGQAICQVLRDLAQQQGRTIVVVTHEPTVAVWAERVVVVKDGKILTSFATSDFPDSHSLAAHYQDLVNVRVAVGANS
ncbi:MAG TPA: ABC transporter ATP-binding protein [Pirellulales bacterium]